MSRYELKSDGTSYWFEVPSWVFFGLDNNMDNLFYNILRTAIYTYEEEGDILDNVPSDVFRTTRNEIFINLDTLVMEIGWFYVESNRVYEVRTQVPIDIQPCENMKISLMYVILKETTLEYDQITGTASLIPPEYLIPTFKKIEFVCEWDEAIGDSADKDYSEYTIQECIEAKALLDDRLEELGEGKSYKSLEQKAMVLRQVKDNFASFLSQYGITLTSDKVSSEWVEKFKDAINKVISGDLTEFIDEDVAVIRPYLFCNVRNLQRVVIPNATEIGDYAFGFEVNKAPLLQNGFVATNVRKIGNYAFSYSNIGNLLSGSNDFSNVQEIGDYAFQNSSMNENHIYFDNVNKIGRSAFYGCRFTKIEADHDIEFGVSAFGNNYNTLKKISLPYQKVLPNNFANGYYTISKDDSLEEIDLSSVEEIGEAALDQHNLMKGYSFDNVLVLKANAFRAWGNKYNPREYELSFNAMTELKINAFSSCPHNLRFENVKTLGYGSGAFAGCLSEKIYLYSVELIDSYGFGTSTTVCSIQEVFLPNLKTISNSSGIQNTKALMIWLPELENITFGTKQIDKNSVCKYIYMPKFKQPYGTPCISANSLLEAINFGYCGLRSQIFQSNYSLKCIILMSTTPPDIDSRITQSTSSYNPIYNSYRFFGTVNATYNPNGDKDGYFYVPDEAVETYKTITESGKNWNVIADRIKGHSEIPEEYKFLLTGEYNGEYKDDYEAYLLRKASQQTA